MKITNNNNMMIVAPTIESSSSTSSSMLKRINWFDDDSDSDEEDEPMHSQQVVVTSWTTGVKNANAATTSSSASASASSRRFQDCYSKQGLLGQGGFAKVFHCRSKQQQQRSTSVSSSYAVKELIHRDYQRYGEDWSNEMNIMKQMVNGPYIVQLVDVFVQPQDDQGCTYLVMTALHGGDLLDAIGNRGSLTQDETRTIGRSLLTAVDYCHTRNIAHRDIKPENILLVDEEDVTKIQLADWGCAKQRPSNSSNSIGFCKTLVGTPLYRAPEMFLGTRQLYDERCDLWAVGVVLYCCLGGYAPFDAPDDEVQALICQGDFCFDDDTAWDDVSQDPKDLITSLLVVNPDNRATIQQALTSPWLSPWLSSCHIVDDYDEHYDHAGTSFNDWLKHHNCDASLISNCDDHSETSSLDSMYFQDSGIAQSLDYHHER